MIADSAGDRASAQCRWCAVQDVLGAGTLSVAGELGNGGYGGNAERYPLRGQ